MPVLMHRSRLMSNNKNLLTYLLYGATVDLMNKTRCEMRHVKAVLFICGTWTDARKSPDLNYTQLVHIQDDN